MAGTNMARPSSLWQTLIREFNLLWFIMALGFGGTSVSGFAFLNNTMPRNPPLKGMLFLEKINEFASVMSGPYNGLVTYLKIHMVFFGVKQKHFVKYPGWPEPEHPRKRAS